MTDPTRRIRLGRRGAAGLAALVALAALAPIVMPPATADDADPDTTRLGLQQRLTRAASALASDIGFVVTSPARLNREGAFWTVVILGTTAAVYSADEEILDRMQRGPDHGVYEVMANVGDALEPAGFMPNSLIAWGGAAVVGEVAGWERLERASLQIIESHLIDGGIRNVSKWIIGRRRPFEGKGRDFFEFNGGTSFPSGHTSVIFETATVVSHHVDRLPVTVLCYGLATSVALQRIESRGHWPSDVFLSAAVGTVVARTVVRRWEGRESKTTALQLEPRGTGLALTYRF